MNPDSCRRNKMSILGLGLHSHHSFHPNHRYWLAVNSQTTIQNRQNQFFHTLGSTLQDQGERGVSPSVVRRVATTLFPSRATRRPLGRREVSWNMSREGERTHRQRPAAAPRECVVNSMQCEQQRPLEAVQPTHDCWVWIQQVHLGQQVLQVSLTRKKRQAD
jgi:hypothetical protein